MFGKKKAVRNDFDEKIRAAKYERILQTLKDILKVEIKAPSKDGREEVDPAATCSAIKTKARLAIDFITDLEKQDGD